ncbi:MAG: hypothetical protein ACLQJR_07995 [Stellaceae bacterium]
MMTSSGTAALDTRPARAMPQARAATPSWFRSTAARRAVFRVWRDERGLWRVEGSDGMTGGAFFERAAALRFARRESTGVPMLVLIL